MENFNNELNQLKNGKDIILQNLEISRVEKNLKFIENEVNNKIIDLRSNQYLKYEVYNQNNKIIFKTLKKIDLTKQLLENKQKPHWLSKTEFLKLEDESLTLNEKNEIIDHILQRYDAFMDKNYTKFIRFTEKQRDFIKDKKQHVLFKISFLITGKLNSGDEIRTPFLLEKINLTIDHKQRQITIKSLPKKEFLINHIFLTWLANKQNYPIENDFKKIDYINQFSEIKETKLLELYENLGISLNFEHFENLSYNQINLRKENVSSKIDQETASHEAKHLLIAYYKNAFIPYVEINNTNSKYGTTLIEENNNDNLTLKDQLAIFIAPLSKGEINSILNFSIKKSYGSDAYWANQFLNELSNDDSEKQFILNQVFNQNEQILATDQFRKKHDLFVKYLLKHKSMDADEIIEQLNSNIPIDSYYQEVNEQKIERNTFFVEKVDALALFTNLENDKIYKDTNYILHKTNFIENLLEVDTTIIDNSIKNIQFNKNLVDSQKINLTNSPNNKWAFAIDQPIETSKNSIFINSKKNTRNLTSGENYFENNFLKPPFLDDINWGFFADIHQQEAIKKALKSKKVIIQGPPGTGKTQIILNIITNNLFHKKRTLIISEKITAVDVINRKISTDRYLNKFIMDLYNLDEKRIAFYNDLSKILTIYNKNFYDYSIEYIKGPYFNEKEKLKIEEINTKIERVSSFLEQNKISLDNYIQISKNIPTIVEKNLLHDINLDDFKLLNQINFVEYEKFKVWNEQRIFFKNLTKIFNYSINTTIICKILKIYKHYNVYNELNKFNCLFILLNEKTLSNQILKPFIKRKLKVLSKKNKLRDEEKFLEKFFSVEMVEENIINFEKFLKFNNNKYTNDQFKQYNKFSKLIQTNIEFNRLHEIYQYLLFINNLKLIRKDFTKNIFFNLPSLNDKEKLELGRYRAVVSYKEVINAKLNNNFALRKEIKDLKNRKNITKNIKTFIYDNWNNLETLFPVVLATPENVSNHIPLEHEMFDTLIIDEASQMFLERAFPAIFRSKQIIVIGDKNQLRPLKIGERANTNIAKNHIFKFQELVENESILDLFNFIIKDQNNLMLKTHYRSYFESLIKFSNENFYDKNLKFIEQNTNDFKAANSIEIINVKDGLWKNQMNEKEADQIIKLINDFFTKNNNLSMGIILFSKKQSSLVKNKLYIDGNAAAKKSFQQTDENALFIKSIDQVQGEERDVIVFGITYGKNTRNYGLLSREYGENRINVATTRAKRKIFLVKSYNANEYPLKETYISNGPKTLINFIKFCEEFVNNSSDDKYLNNKNLLVGNNDIANIKKIIYQIKEKQKNYQIYNLEFQDLMKEFLIKNKNHSQNNLEFKKSLDFWFYFEKSNNFAYYLVDNSLLKNPKEKLWFYDQLLKVRNYIPKPIYFNELIEFIEDIYY